MARSPNIIWLTLDSVRADHTSMEGYRRDTTPELNRISNESEGEWFPNCIAHANSTRISTASVVTGTYPSDHNVTGKNQ